MTTYIYVETEEGRSQFARTLAEAELHWEMLEAHGYTPVEITGNW